MKQITLKRKALMQEIHDLVKAGESEKSSLRITKKRWHTLYSATPGDTIRAHTNRKNSPLYKRLYMFHTVKKKEYVITRMK